MHNPASPRRFLILNTFTFDALIFLSFLSAIPASLCIKYLSAESPPSYTLYLLRKRQLPCYYFSHEAQFEHRIKALHSHPTEDIGIAFCLFFALVSACFLPGPRAKRAAMDYGALQI